MSAKCKRCGDTGTIPGERGWVRPCDGRGCDASIIARGEVTDDEIERIRALAVTARDNPATYDDRDCPTVTLWEMVRPDDLVKLCNTARRGDPPIEFQVWRKGDEPR